MSKKDRNLLHNKSIKNIISNMTLKAKIGQLIMVGFHGSKVNQSVKEIIKDYKVGGIIYFARNLVNPAQTAELSKKLQEISLDSLGLPLFISTDEEGGIVHRVKGMTHFPGAMSLGAAGSERLTEKAAKIKGNQLKYLGINFNLSPVLDVNINPDNPIVGVRSFGSKPERVAELGKCYIKGLQEADVIACGKHFPGHGDTKVDSHIKLPIIDNDMERLEEVELKPFKKAIETGIDSIMSAHISFPALAEKVNLPATLSSNILTGLLREKLNFNGLIITDCMEMNGIVDSYGTSDGAVKAIQAGADQVLISHTPLKQIEALEKIEKAVKKDKIKINRIDKSIERILASKQKRINMSNYTSYDKDEFKLYLKKGNKIAEKVSRKSITLLDNKEKFVPLNKNINKRLLIIDMSETKISPVENPKEKEGWRNKDILINKLTEKGFIIEDKLIKEDNKNKSNRFSIVKDLKKEINSHDFSALIILLEKYEKKSIKEILIKNLVKKKFPLIIIYQGSPYSAMQIKIAPVLLIYDNSSIHIESIIEILTGSAKPKGKLPVN